MKNPRILIVDDQPINIKIVQRRIERAGMDVLAAYNGEDCLRVVEEQRPDIILLDVIMPGMDGFETCQRLKANPETADIPIIFITAKSAKEDVLAGLDTGAVDYITKPLELDETLARIRTQLRVQEMHRENLDLIQRLSEMRKTSTIGAITEGIAHNLNNLLGVVVGYIDLMKIGKGKPELVERSIASMESAINRMVTIVGQLSSMAANETMQLAPVSIGILFENCVKRFQSDYSVDSEVAITNPFPEDFHIETNCEIFEGAVSKLLINALESYPANQVERPIELRASLNDEQTKLFVEVIDQGTGIAKEVEDNFFEPFITTKTSVGRGMGLTVARHSLRNINCDLTVEPNPDRGVCARISIPLPLPEEE
ncbi:MAG: Response regulator PleD [Verrucomicrobia bacterium ADurb.Bin474]|nr:MAG: Response regulator PleD [Verrucomicrobia bacterium ADurb.Bin474]